MFQADENLYISSCISCSSLALRAQSSAKSRSLITVYLTCLGLNSLPSYLFLTEMLKSVSLKASVSTPENINLNRVGSRTQPYLTPFITCNGFEEFPSSSTRAIILSWNCLIIFRKSSGQPNFIKIFHRPSMLTVSLKGFHKIHEGHVQILTLLHALFLQLTSSKDYIDDSSI